MNVLRRSERDDEAVGSIISWRVVVIRASQGARMQSAVEDGRSILFERPCLPRSWGVNGLDLRN